MITKEQAMNADNFIQIKAVIYSGAILTRPEPRNWRRNGKTKTWKTRPNEFKIPVKHGLYSYGYITQDNAHLFEVEE